MVGLYKGWKFCPTLSFPRHTYSLPKECWNAFFSTRAVDSDENVVIGSIGDKYIDMEDEGIVINALGVALVRNIQLNAYSLVIITLSLVYFFLLAFYQ
jgi:hypothetical protein